MTNSKETLIPPGYQIIYQNDKEIIVSPSAPYFTRRKILRLASVSILGFALGQLLPSSQKPSLPEAVSPIPAPEAPADPPSLGLTVRSLPESFPSLEIFSAETVFPLENGTLRLKFGQPISYTTFWPQDESGPAGSRFIHNALDIQGVKNQPVLAPADSEVVYVGPVYRGPQAQGDQVVILYHPQFSLYSSFGHNSQALVGVGDKVRVGQPVALLGDKGFCTPGYYHIHWELWRCPHPNFKDWRHPWPDGQLINPQQFLKNPHAYL